MSFLSLSPDFNPLQLWSLFNIKMEGTFSEGNQFFIAFSEVCSYLLIITYYLIDYFCNYLLLALGTEHYSFTACVFLLRVRKGTCISLLLPSCLSRACPLPHCLLRQSWWLCCDSRMSLAFKYTFSGRHFVIASEVVIYFCLGFFCFSKKYLFEYNFGSSTCGSLHLSHLKLLGKTEKLD